MSSTNGGLDVDRLAPPAVDGVRVLPVVHDRVEMAAVVRRVLDRLKPAAVAVELPPAVEKAALAAVRRLPQLSVVVSEPLTPVSAGDLPSLWLAAPGEPFSEALRWAVERGARPLFIDREVAYGERYRDPVPDPWALVNLGAERYFELLEAAVASRPSSDADRLREQSMAHRLQRGAAELRASGGGEIVALVGAVHAPRLRRALAAPVAQPFVRPSRRRVLLRNLHPESLSSVLSDPPLAHAAWETVRGGGSLPEAPDLEATVVRRRSVARLGFELIVGAGEEGDAARGRRLASRAAAEATRSFASGRIVDRAALARVVWETAVASFRERTQERVARWQERLFFDFSRRCARLSTALVAGLFEWVVAARGVADDNLAWEVFDAACTYPWQLGEAEIDTARIDGSQLDLGTRTIRFRRRHLRTKRRLLRVPVKRRPTEDPEEWLRGFDSSAVCSYPPEDLVIEDYGRFLQAKAVSLLSAERTRVEPFTASLLDGVDLRETLRRWNEGRVYVKEIGRAPGRAGSVVVIFDEDPDDVAYPYRMTWLGEHDQESDMAFYSTVPAEQVVGPGILRATYGGFVLTSPRGRLFDVWTDPDYVWASRKPEVLLMAAIDYSTEKIVVHAARKPPAERWRRYAALQGKRIAHVPLSALSPRTLAKVRVLHLLAGHDKRKIAKDYVW